jgi:hypothetical protein
MPPCLAAYAPSELIRDTAESHWREPAGPCSSSVRRSRFILAGQPVRSRGRRQAGRYSATVALVNNPNEERLMTTISEYGDDPRAERPVPLQAGHWAAEAHGLAQRADDRVSASSSR